VGVGGLYLGSLPGRVRGWVDRGMGMGVVGLGVVASEGLFGQQKRHGDGALGPVGPRLCSEWLYGGGGAFTTSRSVWLAKGKQNWVSPGLSILIDTGSF
jgi:hypothetical protein